MPATLSIIVNTFPARERPKGHRGLGQRHRRGRASRSQRLSCSATLVRFIFLIDVPIIAIALVGGALLVPRSRDPERRRSTRSARSSRSSASSKLVYGLIEAPSSSWTSTSTLGASRSRSWCSVMFVAWELRVKEPMLDMRYPQPRSAPAPAG
jgi:hypothetical protein